MPELNEREEWARKRVCLALDVPTVSRALELVGELSEFVGMYKIGKELHAAACDEGVPIIGRIYSASNQASGTFLDLKFHDTPATVGAATRVCTILGVYMMDLHISGGETMCKKAVEASYETSGKASIERPKIIGVTELTSLSDTDLEVQGLGIKYDDLVLLRTELARKWGLDGVVCPASKAGDLERRFGSDFLYVTPGIEWGGKSGEGQKQLYTPGQAVRDCRSSILVVGSAITKAQDRRTTAYEILQDMVKYI